MGLPSLGFDFQRVCVLYRTEICLKKFKKF